MLQLLPALVLLGALVAPEGTSCASPAHCGDVICPSAQDSCLFSQRRLENGTVVENGSCVTPGQCREGVSTLTYGPNSSLWVSTACCANGCSVVDPQQEPRPKANHVICQYCSGNKSAPCDSLSIMSCIGNQTKCVTLNGTWSGGDPQILKGCATPDVCRLQVNDTLGPEASGFRLISKPECDPQTPPTQTGLHAAVIPNPGGTVCFTCSDLHHCDPLPCSEDRNYCLKTEGVIDFGNGNSVSWRNGSCVASTDCTSSNSISALTYGVGSGYWVKTTCCQGNCQEPTLPTALPASRTLSKFLCPICPKGQPGSCSSSLYVQCPYGEIQCVQLDLTSDEGRWNVSVRGCGSRDLCSSQAVTQRLQALPDLPGLRGLRLSHRPYCNPRRRAVLQSQTFTSAAHGLRLALSVLVVALGVSLLC